MQGFLGKGVFHLLGKYLREGGWLRLRHIFTFIRKGQDFYTVAVHHHIPPPITYNATYTSPVSDKALGPLGHLMNQAFTTLFLSAFLAYQLPPEWRIILCLLHSRAFPAHDAKFFHIPATNQF